MPEEQSQIENDRAKDPNAPAPELNATAARQGRPEGVVRYILGIGLPVAFITLMVLFLIFVLGN